MAERQGVAEEEALPAADSAAARRHEEYGGFSLASAFFGWLVATALGILLTAILSAIGTAVGFGEVTGAEAQANAGTIGIVGGVILLIVFAIAYYAGGYVAGRMARFDGARQGAGVWGVGLAVTILLAVIAAAFGSQYDVLAQLDLPRIPIEDGALATGGLIALVLFLLVSLGAAVLGGKLGERYHARVDRVT